MDRDEIFRQGKGIADKLNEVDRDALLRQGKGIADMLLKEAGTQAAQHEEQIRGFLGMAAGFVNEKTGGRYAEQVGKATDAVEQGLTMLADTGRTEPPPSGPAPSGPTSPPSGPTGPPPSS